MTAKVSEMVGGTLVDVTRARVGDDEVTFTLSDGRRFKLFHDQDCCESVTIAEIVGEWDDIVGSPLVLAEETTNADGPRPEYAESYTWTFYRFMTAKGSVVLRWLGQSNGYYSESVCFKRMREGA